MRLLLQPRVLSTAALASALSTVACYPRLALWSGRPFPVWYLEAMIFLCGIMLWGFVFAWHKPYSARPVFVWPPDWQPFTVATAAGTALALASHFWVDPLLRSRFPEEYPPDWPHWLAVVPFTLALNQLFCVFAPVDWLMRLTRSRRAAAVLTGLLAAALLLLKAQKLAVSLPPPTLAAMLLARLAAGTLVAWLYLRGGVGLVWWWGVLLESRLLLDFH
jgi:hypothetical protein